MKITFTFVLSLVIWIATFAQETPVKLTSCKYAKEIVIDALGNIAPITNSNYLLKDKESNYLSYYPTHEKKSFWYKLKVLSDCEITFDIFPMGEGDTYNFFVYKNPEEGNFCDNVLKRKIIPIRTNMMKDSMQMGTGLASNVIVDNEETEKLREDMLYHTAYHHPIHAVSGHEYYINVYHMQGDDCGHLFKLNVHNVNNSSAGFRTVFQGCYKDEIKRVNPIIPVTDATAHNQVSEIKTKTFKNKLLIRGMIAD
ncbi:MAG: hypothetical protein MRY83_03270, partial [Flavobacteriales bacterium]|nr:hypothetical protein [Flavobacteriales bacterium]